MWQPERQSFFDEPDTLDAYESVCVGRPPRRATRNSLSQRLSRLVRSAASFAGRALRAIFPDVAITVEGSKFLLKRPTRSGPLGYRPAAVGSRCAPCAQALIAWIGGVWLASPK